MMLAASALSAAAAAATACVFSPSANTCMKRVSATRFRYEPYGIRVVASSFVSTPLSSHKSSSVTAEMASSVTVAAPVAPVSITAPSPISVVMPTVSPVVAAAPATSVAAHGFRYAVIKFKQETATFIAPFRTVVGETVVVEGDRGENIGVVQEISQAAPSFDVKSRILRKATEKDLTTLSAQREREASTLKQVQALSSSIGLHATIEDVEYQFDLNKLTIFVRRSAKGGFVDFRKLQRSLFREFRCRIWCSYMDEVEAVENGPRCR
jgi:hypothetical protein